MLDAWKTRARALAAEVWALALACRDPRVPWYARALAVLVVAYALSPIDLIPDPIPVLGYLDDLVLLPLGILLVRRLVPEAVLADCRARARGPAPEDRRLGRLAALGVVGVWLVLGAALVAWLVGCPGVAGGCLLSPPAARP